MISGNYENEKNMGVLCSCAHHPLFELGRIKIETKDR
jgi:hypothetical protein